MGRPRSFDESAALATASREFRRTGYAGTSIDDIAAKMGLGKGSLYNAFGDKRQLFARAFDDYCTRIVASVRRDLAGPDDEAFARLCGHVRAVAAGTASDVDHRGCFLAKGTAECSEHDAEVASRARRTFDELEDVLADDIRAAQRHGDLDATADPTRLAGVVLAVLRGIEALGKGGKSGADLTAIADAAIELLPRAASIPKPIPKPKRKRSRA